MNQPTLRERIEEAVREIASHSSGRLGQCCIDRLESLYKAELLAAGQQRHDLWTQEMYKLMESAGNIEVNGFCLALKVRMEALTLTNHPYET